MRILIMYILISVIYTTISLIDGYLKLKRKCKTDLQLKQTIFHVKDIFIKMLFSGSPLIKTWKYLVFNPYGISVIIIIYIASCVFFFPYTLFGIIDNIINPKIDHEQAKKESDEWLKNEGRGEVEGMPYLDEQEPNSYNDINEPKSV